MAPQGREECLQCNDARDRVDLEGGRTRVEERLVERRVGSRYRFWLIVRRVLDFGVEKEDRACGLQDSVNHLDDKEVPLPLTLS